MIEIGCRIWKIRLGEELRIIESEMRLEMYTQNCFEDRTHLTLCYTGEIGQQNVIGEAQEEKRITKIDRDCVCKYLNWSKAKVTAFRIQIVHSKVRKARISK